MSSVTVGDDSPLSGAFYRCVDRDGCGLRFPVALNDPFGGRCPRCGGAVQLVARVEVGGESPGRSNGASCAPGYLHLLLDNWRSLFNVGAAFRTADGAGVRHLFLCGITATPEGHPKLAKTALGAEKAVSWSYHADGVRLAESLRQEGVQLWVLERSAGSIPLFDITTMPADAPVVLAAGNEVVGVDPGLVGMADRVIHLPMVGRKGSLNVAVALSIATYWLRGQALRAASAG